MNLKVLSAIAIATIVTSFNSCKKDTTASTDANVQIVQASPNGPSVDGYVNGSLRVTNLSYGNASAYFATSAGTNNIKVTSTGTTTAIFNVDINLEAGKFYSVFVIDSASKAKAATTNDDMTPPASGKSRIRFLDFIPNSPRIDLAVTGSSTIFTNRSFNDQVTNTAVQNFTEVNAGNLNLELRLTGTSTVILPIPTITLQAGKIYTIYARGFVGGTASQALNYQLITHN